MTVQKPNAALFAPAAIDPTKEHRDWIAGVQHGPVQLEDGGDFVLAANLKTEEKFGVKKLKKVQERSFQSYIVPARMMARVRKLDEPDLPHGQLPEFDRLYLGEYPRSAACRIDTGRWQLDAPFWGKPTSVILKGNDEAFTATRDLWAPEAALQVFADAYHDGASAWATRQGEQVASEARDRTGIALRFSKTVMGAYLEQEKASLVWISFDSRMIFNGYDLQAFADLLRLWEWKKGAVKMVGAFFARQEDGDDDVDLPPLV